MRRVALPLMLLLALAMPAASAWASGSAVLNDCADDEQLSKKYSQQDYRDALSNMDADVRQYTNCEAVIRQAQLAAASSSAGNGGGGSGGTGGGFAGGTGSGTGGPTASAAETLAKATPEQKRELAQAVEAPPAPVTLPGVGAIDPASAGEVPGIDAVGDLPTPLGILLICMVGAGAVLVVNRVRHRVDGRSAS